MNKKPSAETGREIGRLLFLSSFSTSKPESALRSSGRSLMLTASRWHDLRRMKTNFVRLTYKGCDGRNRTVWAHKFRKGSYRRVNNDGEWGFDNVDHRILISHSDLIRERPAQINKKYGSLEII